MSDQGSGNTKEIKFSFVVDQASAQSVMKTLKDLTDQAEKFAKALQSAAGAMTGGGSFFGGGTAGGKAAGAASTITKAAGRGGTTSGGSAITNVVMENAKAFKSMSTMSGDALKSMQDILKKSVEEQKRSINDLDKTIANLGKSYQQLKKDQQEAVAAAQKLGIDPKLISAQYGNKLSQTAKDLAEARGDRTGEMEVLKKTPGQGMFGDMKNAFLERGGGMGGVWGAMNANINVPGGGMMGDVMSGLGMGALSKLAVPAFALWAAKAGFDETRENSRRQIDTLADRGRVINPIVSQLRSGDTSFMAKQKFLLEDKSADGLRQELMDQFQGAGAKLEAFQGMSGGILSKISSALGAGASTFTGSDIMDPRMQTELMKKYIEHVNKVGETVEHQQNYGAWNEYQGQSSGMRRAMQMAGGEGRGYRDVVLRDEKGNPIASSGRQKFYDDYLDKDIDLTRRGFSMGELHSSRMQMLGSAGEEGRRYGEQAMSAASAGYGGYNNILAQSIRMGQGDKYARMAIGGGIDKTAGFQLGAGVMGLNPFGLTDSSGIFAAIQNSGALTGGGQDFQTTNRMLAGLQAGNALTTASPYNLATGLLGANSILEGRNLGYKSSDYLNEGMSIADMINVASTGKMTEKGESLGLKSGDVQKELNVKLMAALNESFDTTSDDPMSKALGKFYESKESQSGDIMGYAKKLMASGNKKEGKNLLMNAFDALGMGEGESLGLIDVIMGHSTGKGAGKGGVGAGKLSGVEADEAEYRAQQLKRIRELDEKMTEQKRAELQNAEQMAKTLQNFGQNMGDSAERLTGSLGKLDEAVNLAAQNMTKLMDPKDAAKFNRPPVVKSPNAVPTAPVSSQSSAPNMSSQPIMSSSSANYSSSSGQ